jgi:HNH endonuclease
MADIYSLLEDAALGILQPPWARSGDFIVEDRGYETPCWVWQKGTNGKRSGDDPSKKVNGRTVSAHHYYYEQAYGEIPPRLEMHHKSEVALCARPDHLETVTHAYNMWIRHGRKVGCSGCGGKGKVSLVEPKRASIGTLAPEAGTSDLVRCFRHEGQECPRCDGSGYRPRKRCAACAEPAGRPSEGGKTLQPYRASKSWEQARSLLLYCRECNPRFASLEAVLVVLQRMSS